MNAFRLYSSSLLLTAAFALAPFATAENNQKRLNLEDALRFAVENNFTIKQAKERIRQQEGVVLETKALSLPKLTASASYSLNEKEISTSFPADDRAWGISIKASQTVYAGGGVRASIQSARLSREAALLELQGIVSEQLLRVRTAYYAVLFNRERIQVQEENIKLLEEQLKTARNRFNAGSASNFDVLRAEVSLANGHPPLIQARNDYRLSIEEFRQTLGMTAANSGPIDVVGSLVTDGRDELQLSDALSTARAKRPELQRIAKLTEAGEQSVRAAQSALRPSVEVFGRYDFAKGSAGAGWPDRIDGATVGVQGQWAIFDGRNTKGKTLQARSRLQQTKLSLEEYTLAIDVEVRRALSSRQEAWELVDSSNKVVSQAEEALRLANVRYGTGSATQLDVLTSQVALLDARLNQLSAVHRCNVAQAALRKALGASENYSAE